MHPVVQPSVVSLFAGIGGSSSLVWYDRKGVINLDAHVTRLLVVIVRYTGIGSELGGVNEGGRSVKTIR